MPCRQPDRLGGRVPYDAAVGRERPGDDAASVWKIEKFRTGWRGMPPAAYFFLACQKRHSAPFSLRGKEKAAGGKKKTAKGAFRISPFANPLKTTKKGAAAPFLGFSPGLGLCGSLF